MCSDWKNKQEMGQLLVRLLFRILWDLNHLRNNSKKHMAVGRIRPELEGFYGGGFAAAGRTLSKHPRGPFNIY